MFKTIRYIIMKSFIGMYKKDRDAYNLLTNKRKNK